MEEKIKNSQKFLGSKARVIIFGSIVKGDWTPIVI
uniref:Polymerase nucleotidyl transferase domain-containing protein n=1 Tax=Thermodesulfobacterium geofontis TaxID=1295609 RepID=A0A7V5XGH1_9BACT